MRNWCTFLEKRNVLKYSFYNSRFGLEEYFFTVIRTLSRFLLSIDFKNPIEELYFSHTPTHDEENKYKVCISHVSSSPNDPLIYQEIFNHDDDIPA
jgi:hypothetical protein